MGLRLRPGSDMDMEPMLEKRHFARRGGDYVTVTVVKDILFTVTVTVTMESLLSLSNRNSKMLAEGKTPKSLTVNS